MVAASKPASASRRRCVRCRAPRRCHPADARRDRLSPASVGSSKARRGVDDLTADPLAQLLAGGAAERDQQHLVQRRDALGHVAGDQTGQRERLAGARAGLQHGGRCAAPAAGPADRSAPSDDPRSARAPAATGARRRRRAGVSRRRLPRPAAAVASAPSNRRPRPTPARAPVLVLAGMRCRRFHLMARRRTGSSPLWRLSAHAYDVLSGSGSGSRRPAS